MGAKSGGPNIDTEYFLVPRKGGAEGGGVGGREEDSGNERAGVGLLREEPWVLPLLAFSLLTIVLIAVFEVVVLLRCRRRRRRLRSGGGLNWRGRSLLLGLLLTCLSSLSLSLSPSVPLCSAVELGAGLGPALALSSLLVESLALCSLEEGVYLPASYRRLLLFFAVLVQAALSTQALLISPPKPLPEGGGCGGGRSGLGSVVYPSLLLAGVAALASRTRQARREALWIGLAAAAAAPVALGWSLAALVVVERNRDACLGFGLSGSALVVFLVVFLPKGRRLATLGRRPEFPGDKEERLSSLGRPASPSFLHFKPVATFDRVALVAPPPSYGHHYYPYCYYSRPVPGGSPMETSMYTSVEPTLSTNPNVFFHRGLHPGMMY